MKITIIGRKYEDKVTYYDFDVDKKWGYCDKVVDDKKWEIFCKDDYEAQIWLVSNYPEYSMGASYLWDEDKNGKFHSFYFTAVPSEDCYGKGNFENTENRIAYMKRELGVA